MMFEPDSFNSTLLDLNVTWANYGTALMGLFQYNWKVTGGIYDMITPLVDTVLPTSYFGNEGHIFLDVLWK